MARKSEILRQYNRIHRLLEVRKSVLVLGPRGSGKTYFLSSLVKDFAGQLIHIDLLKNRLFDRYLRNPDMLFKEVSHALNNSSQDTLVFIDEIQKIPSLLDEVHSLIEKFKPRLTFILTGSSARKLKSEQANLLAGRAITVNFFPLGIDEVSYIENERKILQYGLLPEVFTTNDEELCREFLNTYVGTYLDEEIKREAGIRNLPAFAKFLELAAAYNGKQLNYSKVARAVNIADVTVKEYYQILIDTLVGYFVHSWTHSIHKQLLQAPRFYFFDNGVANALTGELHHNLRPSTNTFGRFFESFVVTQIVQFINKNNLPLKIYNYREKNGREIDLILQQNPFSAPIAIEIKSAEAPSSKSSKALKAFKEMYSDAHVLVICRTEIAYEEDGIQFLPIMSALDYLKVIS